VDLAQTLLGDAWVVDSLERLAVGFDGVAVMAYICKRIPKCPDPDPALKWN